jgi:hypothetical protein
MKCEEHITREEQLPYLAWHSKAAESTRKGIRQTKCGECGLFIFPWERRDYVEPER